MLRPNERLVVVNANMELNKIEENDGENVRSRQLQIEKRLARAQTDQIIAHFVK